MRISLKQLLIVTSVAALLGTGLQGCNSTKPKINSTVAKSDTTRSIAPFFIKATNKVKTPDNDGFIQRWMLLEPINKPNRGNTVYG
jgi:hypothetical protein